VYGVIELASLTSLPPFPALLQRDGSGVATAEAVNQERSTIAVDGPVGRFPEVERP
jgi:hypothetical protein